MFHIVPDGAGEQKQRFLSYRQCHGPLGDFLNIQIVYLNSTAQQIQPLLSVVLQRLRPPAPPTFMHAYCQDETLISKVGGFCERARQNECCPPVKSTLQPFSSLSTLSPPLKRLTDVHSASLSKNFFPGFCSSHLPRPSLNDQMHSFVRAATGLRYLRTL